MSQHKSFDLSSALESIMPPGMKGGMGMPGMPGLSSMMPTMPGSSGMPTMPKTGGMYPKQQLHHKVGGVARKTRPSTAKKTKATKKTKPVKKIKSTKKTTKTEKPKYTKTALKHKCSDGVKRTIYVKEGKKYYKKKTVKGYKMVAIQRKTASKK